MKEVSGQPEITQGRARQGTGAGWLLVRVGRSRKRKGERTRLMERQEIVKRGRKGSENSREREDNRKADTVWLSRLGGWPSGCHPPQGWVLQPFTPLEKHAQTFTAFF